MTKKITLTALGVLVSMAVLVGTSGPILAGGAVVQHGDGSTSSFTANNGAGLRLVYTWTDNPGDIIREKDGSGFYKINARSADVVLEVMVAPGIWIPLGGGTAHLSISGDYDEGTVGSTKFNFKSHGDLVDTVIPPPLGTGFGDYTFRVDLVRRKGVELKNVVIVKPAS